MKSGGIIALVVLALASWPPAGGAAVRSSPAEQQVAALYSLVNSTRAAHGLPKLRRSRALDRSALMKAQDIRRCGSFTHTPCGAPFSRTFQRTGYLHGRVSFGENLYWGSGGAGAAQVAIQAWLNSPPHRANLLGRDWRETGMAVVHSGSLFGTSDVWLFVLQFGRHG